MQMKQVFLEHSAGTEWGVSFVLFSNGTPSSFRGYPDFVIMQEGVGARVVLVTVGETQSNAKDSVPQAGIYGVGEFKKEEVGRKLVCVAVTLTESWTCDAS